MIQIMCTKILQSIICLIKNQISTKLEHQIEEPSFSVKTFHCQPLMMNSNVDVLKNVNLLS